MKFNIENISADGVASAIHAYRRKNGEMPVYITIHPQARVKLIIEAEKESRTFPPYFMSPHTASGLNRNESIYGIPVIVSTDVAEDYIILSR